MIEDGRLFMVMAVGVMMIPASCVSEQGHASDAAGSQHQRGMMLAWGH